MRCRWGKSAISSCQHTMAGATICFVGAGCETLAWRTTPQRLLPQAQADLMIELRLDPCHQLGVVGEALLSRRQVNWRAFYVHLFMQGSFCQC
jgi:hypothetical protein